MIWLFLLLPFLFPRSVLAVDVKITNYSSNSSPEWVEIQNQTSNTIDLTNWVIRDGNASLTDDLTLAGCLSANSYTTFYHDAGWLNDSSAETISLYDSSTNLIDQLSYTKGQLVLNPKNDNTCTPTVVPTAVPTTPPTPTPTYPPLPTITPSPTPIPTNTPVPPTATNTPYPTSTPLPTAVLSPTPTILDNPSPINDPLPTDDPQGQILGSTAAPSPLPTNVVKTKTISANLIPTIFIILGGLLLIIPLVVSKIKFKPKWPRP